MSFRGSFAKLVGIANLKAAPSVITPAPVKATQAAATHRNNFAHLLGGSPPKPAPVPPKAATPKPAARSSSVPIHLRFAHLSGAVFFRPVPAVAPVNVILVEQEKAAAAALIAARIVARGRGVFVPDAVPATAREIRIEKARQVDAEAVAARIVTSRGGARERIWEF
jgi:hypothetical protein